MLFNDRYRTIDKPAEGAFRDRGSKFLAYAYPIGSQTPIKELVGALREGHPKARHFCWAMRIGPDRSVFRMNDDGEPPGTAGRPILNTLLSRDVTNILLVVVRYFGGTLLGVPGLINAYKTAAQEALDAAVILERTLSDTYRIRFPYIRMNEVMKLAKDEALEISRQEFDNDCLLEIRIPRALVNTVISKLENMDDVRSEYLGTG